MASINFPNSPTINDEYTFNGVTYIYKGSDIWIVKDEADFVTLTGNQTVAGVKTFTSFPVTPSSAPTGDFQVANKKYVDDNAGGGGDIVVVGILSKIDLDEGYTNQTIFTFPFEPDTYYALELFLYLTGFGSSFSFRADPSVNVGTYTQEYSKWEGVGGSASNNTNVVATLSPSATGNTGTTKYVRGQARYISPSTGSTCNFRITDTFGEGDVDLQPGSYLKVIKLGPVP
jgi:hypothetical protein